MTHGMCDAQQKRGAAALRAIRRKRRRAGLSIAGSNKGIQQRIEQDKQHRRSRVRKSEEQLKKKAKLYERLSAWLVCLCSNLVIGGHTH